MKLLRTIKFLARDLVYPGLDLNTRNRAQLCCFWKKGYREILDAGSGNGFFSWLAYQSGASVVGINFATDQVDKARAYFLEHRGCDPARLQFEKRNLYELSDEGRRFDEIICYETLEHISCDSIVATHFFRILRPGGILHLCCPNRLHRRHRTADLDSSESGGHVRAGYTEDDYRVLLEPIEFKLEAFAGIGSKYVYFADRFIRPIRRRLGDAFALPLFPLGLLALKFEQLNPTNPYSIYVMAVKPPAE